MEGMELGAPQPSINAMALAPKEKAAAAKPVPKPEATSTPEDAGNLCAVALLSYLTRMVVQRAKRQSRKGKRRLNKSRRQRTTRLQVTDAVL